MLFFNFLTDKTVEITIKDSRLPCVEIFKVFQKFSNLRKLSIIRSNVQEFVYCVQETVPTLNVDKTITDSDTQISSQSIQDFSIQDSLQKIEVFDISGNFISNIEKSILDKWTNLRELNLSSNSITNLEPGLFRDLTNLQVLDLSYNKLNQNLNPAAFKALPGSLKYLDISRELQK